MKTTIVRLASLALAVCLLPCAHAQTNDAMHASFKTADGRDTINFDFTGAPDLKQWGITKAAPALIEWYPKICAMLTSPGFSCSKTVYVQFKNINPPAYTMGDVTTANPVWFRAHPEDADALVHEATHIVQAYGRNGAGYGHNPVWLVEGLDDYIRWYIVEPEAHGADIGPHRVAKVNYNDSYRTTANFLHWVVAKYNPDLIVKLNALMRAHQYSDQTWVDLTGKTADELNTEWKQALLKNPSPV